MILAFQVGNLPRDKELLTHICTGIYINEFRCYEVKTEETEKAGSRWESNPGHLWLVQPVLCH